MSDLPGPLPSWFDDESAKVVLVPMPLLRACCSFLVVLALGLGTVMPAGHWDTTHETTVVAVKNPMAVD